MKVFNQYGNGDNILGDVVHGKPIRFTPVNPDAMALFGDIQRKAEEIVRSHGIDCPLEDMAPAIGALVEETDTTSIKAAIQQGHEQAFQASIKMGFAGTSLHNVRMRSVLRMILAIIESCP